MVPHVHGIFQGLREVIVAIEVVPVLEVSLEHFGIDVMGFGFTFQHAFVGMIRHYFDLVY